MITKFLNVICAQRVKTTYYNLSSANARTYVDAISECIKDILDLYRAHLKPYFGLNHEHSTTTFLINIPNYL